MHMVTKVFSHDRKHGIKFLIQNFRLGYAGSIAKDSDVSNDSMALLEDNAILGNDGICVPIDMAEHSRRLQSSTAR